MTTQCSEAAGNYRKLCEHYSRGCSLVVRYEAGYLAWVFFFTLAIYSCWHSLPVAGRYTLVASVITRTKQLMSLTDSRFQKLSAEIAIHDSQYVTALGSYHRNFRTVSSFSDGRIMHEMWD